MAILRTLAASGVGDSSRAAISVSSGEKTAYRLCNAMWEFEAPFVVNSASNSSFKAIDRVTGREATPRFSAAPTIATGTNGGQSFGYLTFGSNAAIAPAAGNALISASAYTAAFVVRKATADTDNGFVFGAAVDTSTGLRCRIRGASDFGDIDIWHGAGAADIQDDVTSTGFTADTWHLIVISYDLATTTLKLRVDGAEVAEDTSAAAVVASPSATLDLSIGDIGETASSQAYDSDMAAFYMMESALHLTASDLSAFETYVAGKYGISI